MSTLLRSALLLALIAVLAACSATASSSPVVDATAPPPPSAPASEKPVTGAIDHPTGATDVVLRYEEGGGFMMPQFVATQAPHFTLYGDGTIVFRNPLQEAPPAAGPVFFNNPYRTATLSEEQIQELLEFALAEGGLATAKLQYENNMVADAGTAIFTVNAGGLEKTVNVYALGLEAEGVPDMPARAQFKALADRLANFDQNGTIPTDAYTPSGYRVVLIDTNGFAGEAPVAWPWADLTPADFKVDEASGQFFPSRVMTAEELEVLGVQGIEGGFQGLTLVDPADSAKSYALAVRPLLPGETS
jgi:hypothetical protein